MPLPENIGNLCEQYLVKVRQDPDHHLLPVERLELYKLFGPKTKPPLLTPIRGHLALLTARKVLPLWQQYNYLWPLSDDETNNFEEILEKGKNPEYIEVSAGFLPDYFLALTERLLQTSVDINFAWTEANNLWYNVGNMWLDFEVASEEYPQELKYILFALNASLNALLETLGVEFLGKLKGWENYNDDKLSKRPEACDVAGLAITAWVKGNVGKGDSRNLRLEFWEWWLGKAIPQAWDLAHQG